MKASKKFENVKAKLFEKFTINESNINVVKELETQLNWDLNPNGMHHGDHDGSCMRDYIFDEYRGIVWQIIDTSKSENTKMKRLVTSRATCSVSGKSHGAKNLYRVDIDLLLDKYHVCNSKNDKKIHLSKIIKDYCEKNCNLKEHGSHSLRELFGMTSKFDRINNEKEVTENLSKYKFECSCGDFASKIVAFTMDFYSNCFYILFKNEKLYKIAIENSGGGGDGGDWKIISRVNLTQGGNKKKAIWDWDRVSMCYDSIFQRLIVSDRDNVRILYTF